MSSRATPEPGDSRIRTVIADDEPLARDRLRTLLEAEGDAEVVAECGDGKEAIRAVAKHGPDLLFLDIRMPGIDGFGVIDAIGEDAVPAVVFVTAYGEYALQAFEVRGLDYLLKPFDRERFGKTMERVRQHLARRSSTALRSQLKELIDDIRGESRHPERFVIKTGGKVFFVSADEIDWVEAEGNYVRLHVGSSTHLLRETMTRLEERLDASRFVRVHRSSIVNLERVKEMQPWFNGEYVVILKDGTRVVMSRGYRQKLSHLFGSG